MRRSSTIPIFPVRDLSLRFQFARQAMLSAYWTFRAWKKMRFNLKISKSSVPLQIRLQSRSRTLAPSKQRRSCCDRQRDNLAHTCANPGKCCNHNSHVSVTWHQKATSNHYMPKSPPHRSKPLSEKEKR